MQSTNAMCSQHTCSLVSTHMCVEAVCRIASLREGLSYFTSGGMNLHINSCAIREGMRGLMRPARIRHIHSRHRWGVSGVDE